MIRDHIRNASQHAVGRKITYLMFDLIIVLFKKKKKGKNIIIDLDSLFKSLRCGSPENFWFLGCENFEFFLMKSLAQNLLRLIGICPLSRCSVTDERGMGMLLVSGNGRGSESGPSCG